MRKLMILAVIPLLVMFNLLGYSVATTLDIVAATLDGTFLCDMSLDEFGDRFGRASNVEQPIDILAEVMGPFVFWHHFGIASIFGPENEESPPLLLMLEVFPMRRWDSRGLLYYEPFPGQIVPAFDLQSRVDDVLAIFPEEVPMVWFDRSVRIEFPDYNVHINFQNSTRFFEHFHLECMLNIPDMPLD